MYRRINSGWMKHWDFVVLDMICLEFSFLFAYLIRHRHTELYKQNMYIALCLWLVVFDILAVLLSNSYKNILQRTAGWELLAVFRHVTVVEMFLLLYVFITKESADFSRMVYLLGWGLSLILCFGTRIVWKRIVRKRVLSQKHQSNMLVLSTKERVRSCIRQLYEKEFREFRICAVALLEKGEEDFAFEFPTIYGRDALLEYVRTDVVDEIYIDVFENRKHLNELVDTFLGTGLTVHINTGFFADYFPNQFIEKIGKNHVVTTSIKTAASWELALKRLMDVVGALIGLILTGIATVFVAPAIKIASPGPVFFRQQRVGKNGRIFSIYKFRSMYMDAEERKKELMSQNEMQGLMFKMENDPRIIGSEKGPGKGIGNFIRKTSIDELPQFWNILKGDMSLVGTRPPTVNEYEQYDLHHKIRLSMKPGLTGMWQVSGRSDITDFEEVVKLDSGYIENWSLWLDIKILLKTVKVVFEKEGSR